MSIKEIKKLENQFPKLAGKAFAAARKRTRKAGLPVLHSENGMVYRTLPDDTKEFVKSIDPPVRVKKGQIFIIE